MLDGYSVIHFDNKHPQIYGNGHNYSIDEAIELGILTPVQGGFGDSDLTTNGEQ